jgi:hypothetical protein
MSEIMDYIQNISQIMSMGDAGNFRFAYVGRNQWAEISSKLGGVETKQNGRFLEANIVGIKLTVMPVDDFGPVLSKYDWATPPSPSRFSVED